MGPQAGLGEAGPPRPHRATAGEEAALSGLGSDSGTPVSGNTAPVSPRLLISPHWGKTTKDEVPPLSSIAGLSGDDHTDALSLRPDPSLAGRPWQKAEESGWRQQRAIKGKRISHAERTFSSWACRLIVNIQSWAQQMKILGPSVLVFNLARTAARSGVSWRHPLHPVGDDDEQFPGGCSWGFWTAAVKP